MPSRIAAVNNVNKNQVMLNLTLYQYTHTRIFGRNTSKYILVVAMFGSLNA